MAVALSSRQAEELYALPRPVSPLTVSVGADVGMLHRHKSIIAYLAANRLPNSAAGLRAELQLGEDVFDTATAKKYETLLEKKWTSVVRLQKKVRSRPPRNSTHLRRFSG